ncbi:hypothetical protein ACQUQU_18510 [Thalassolituus sp. LLYu03]|uniref:hypothetical protein n=1 Tax=Thalassolituus sp. LLYu03 TaxID=3421656 RepID=UPI003D2D26C0
MKFSKLMKKLNALFSSEAREHARKKRELKNAMKKIRHKQKELEQELASCHDDFERKRLEEKISILSAQRAKGLELLREMESAP